MPTARGWTQGQTPIAAPGLKVNAFAAGLKHPRWIQTLPNGDVLVAESLTVAGPIKSVFDYAMVSTMRRAAALGDSPNRITRLRDAGLDSIPGGGAEILDDEIRARISRLKCTSNEWEQMHRDAHSLGMRTTATMMFGCGEEYRHRVNHLERVRRIQEETGGFTAFIPWIFAPENTPLGKKVPEATAVDYLKTLAISRMYLENVDHVQSSWLTPGIKVCQVGLQFGADDVGSILIEENVVYAAGVRNRTNEAELRRIISDAGYIPAQRDTLYRSYALNR